jgi:hypothetical protein
VSAAEVERGGSVPQQAAAGLDAIPDEGPDTVRRDAAGPGSEAPGPEDVQGAAAAPPAEPVFVDPNWRVRHLPMLTAISGALALCAASVGFIAGGPDAALGAAGGVLVVAVSFSLSTLVVAWADAVRPALVMPLGMLTYVIKYTLIVAIMIGISSSGWSGGHYMAWGIVGGAVLLTAAQVWWVSRLARADADARSAAGSSGTR